MNVHCSGRGKGNILFQVRRPANNGPEENFGGKFYRLENVKGSSNMRTKRVLSMMLSFALVLGSLGSVSKEAGAAEAAKKVIVYVAAEGSNARGETVDIPKTAVQVEKGSTADVVIKQVLDGSAYKDNYTISDTGWGPFLDKIGNLGTTEDYSYGWGFSVNNQMASVGIGSYVLQGKEQISLVYDAWEQMGTQCSDYANDSGLIPEAQSQKKILENARAQRDLLAQKMYEQNFDKGTYLPGMEDTDSLYQVYSMIQAGYPAEDFYQKVLDKVTSQLETLAKGDKFANEFTGEDITQDSYESNKYVVINYTKIALFLQAMKKDITDIGGMNLAEKITNRSLYEVANPTTFSRESMILFAMNEGDAKWPEGEKYLSEEELVNAVLADVDRQIATSLDASVSWSTMDSAAMVVQALSFYQDKSVEGVDGQAVKDAVDQVIDLLSVMQDNATGGFAGNNDNAWTLAQIMRTVGLFQKDSNLLTDARFVKNGKTLFDASAKYIDVDKKTVDSGLVGGEHAYQPDQLLRGLTACIQVSQAEGSSEEEPGKEPGNNQEENTNPGNQTPVVLKKPVIRKVSSGKKKTLTVKFAKVTNAKKYVIQISADKKFKKNVKNQTVKTAKTVTFKKLKSGKKYYVRVRAYSGKVKSAYSKVVSKKVK